MKITLPKDPRDVPNTREIEDVLLVLCQKAGLKPETISFAVAGGDRRRDFGQQGVKLLSVSSNALGVPMFVGCERETVEGHLVCTEIPRAIDLHGKLLGAFGNRRTHIVDNRRIKNARADFLGNGVPKPAPSATLLGRVSSPLTTPPPLLRDDSEEPLSESSDTAASDVLVSPVVEGGHNPPASLRAEEDNPRSLARNLTNMHLAVVAFATHFKPSEPFGFKRFEQTLAQVDIQFRTALPFIRVLTHAGFLVRLNPGGTPARYVITELCIQVAGADDAEALRLISKCLQKTKEKKDENEAPLTAENLLGQIQSLRASEDEYQKLLRGIEARAQELEKMRSRDLTGEERDIKGQIQNLEKRLAELRAALDKISGDRNRVSMLEQELSEMRKRSGEGPLAMAHENFAKLKELLG